jgi:hypothetical protein
MDAEVAARRQLKGAGDPVGFVEFGQDLGAALEILAADLGEAHPARRAVQKPHAERVFKRLHVVADRRRGHVEPAGRGGEPAALGDSGEGSQAGHAVHAISNYPLSRDSPLTNQPII